MSKCESTGRHSQPGEGLNSGYLRDCEIFGNLRFNLYHLDLGPSAAVEADLDVYILGRALVDGDDAVQVVAVADLDGAALGGVPEAKLYIRQNVVA